MENKLVETIVKALDEKKGMEIKVLDIHAQTGIADYFIIASGTSSPHTKALSDFVLLHYFDENGAVRAEWEEVPDLIDSSFAIFTSTKISIMTSDFAACFSISSANFKLSTE